MEKNKYKMKDISKFSQGIQVPVFQQLLAPSARTKRFLRIVDYTKSDEAKRYVQVSEGRYEVDKNDLIMIRYGSQTAGMIVRGQEGVIANNMFKITTDGKLVDKNYLYYYLSRTEIFQSLNQSQTSSTMPAITFDMVNSLEISLPPLSEQKRMSSILSSFDNKIEQLKKENNILEDIAQNIFKEWFVKYNFPNKDGKPYRDNKGKMIDSELGLIPEGWRVCKLDEIIDLQGGFVHNTKILGEPVSKIAKMGVVDGKSWFNENSVINYSEKIDPKYQLKEDNLVICTRDITRDKIVIGNVSITPKYLADIGLYAGSNTWIVKTKINTYFLFFLFREQKFRNHIINSSKGSTIVMITRDAFLSNSIVFPSEEFLHNLASKISPQIEKIKLNNLLLKKLTSIKNTLLKEFFYNE